MAQRRLLERMWKKDYRVWKPTQVEITNRLGWFTVAEQMQERVGVLKHFAQSVRDAGFRYVVVLGMGGSSLGPEVLRQTFGASRGFLKPFVLDSTVPGAVRDVHDSIDPARTLFIVSSKSGGTIEVMSLFAYFWDVVARARGGSGGNQFIAITDPDTSLGTLAHDRGFRTTFLNPPDIGGRYSVLSYFGLVPAALMGVDVERLLERAVDMTRLCGPTVATQQNPAAFLGAVMGVLSQAGRDKVTLIASPKIQSFGLWAEQLLAESTGKEGNGLIPVAQEPMVRPSAYGQDRLFIALRLDGDANKNIDRHVAVLRRAGYPVVQLRLRDRFDLGAEFFRWEFATAIAGHALRIHPFDQPNVQESKDNTKRILEQFQREGHLPDIKSNSTLEELCAQIKPGDYLAVLAYLRPSAKIDAALKAFRRRMVTRYRIATTAGYGPRYLHSTGQLHKGGPNEGVFLELTERPSRDVRIPGAAYTFDILAQAQAVGDVQSLQAHGRPVVHLALGRQPALEIKALLTSRKQRSSRNPKQAQPKRERSRGRRA
ncbi:MAG: glucose-6-phosphate isomerase [Nitrospirales bacterium]|nr:glucose-6-phosphate isomerase [Nitrospirales bacterium]